MKKAGRLFIKSYRFRRWSNKAYAAFNSMGKTVSIGVLPIAICNKSSIKLGNFSEIPQMNAEQAEQSALQEDDELLLVDNTWDPCAFLTLIGLSCGQNDFGYGALYFYFNFNFSFPFCTSLFFSWIPSKYIAHPYKGSFLSRLFHFKPDRLFYEY